MSEKSRAKTLVLSRCLFLASCETRWNGYVLQTDTSQFDAAESVSSLHFTARKKDAARLHGHRQGRNRVYHLIFHLIKSDCNHRNIPICLISQLPLIITCEMGDVG